jgi:hypothetical protein
MNDHYGAGVADKESDREARVAHVLGRARTLSAELKTTVDELSEMLHSAGIGEKESKDRA